MSWPRHKAEKTHTHTQFSLDGSYSADNFITTQPKRIVILNSQDTRNSHNTLLLKGITQKPHKSSGHQHGAGQTYAHANMHKDTEYISQDL